MKDEYAELIISALIMFSILAISSLVIDLYHDGAFGAIMIVALIAWSPIYGIAFLVQAFRTNYKIVKKK